MQFNTDPLVTVKQAVSNWPVLVKLFCTNLMAFGLPYGLPSQVLAGSAGIVFTGVIFNGY
jgi:hypothetical protein